MNEQPKTKRRGFVMTGGGAKGLYEAGVINAFHLTGMEFDVITGSSIGAMNSIFFAEYLWTKKSLSADILASPENAIEAMDEMIRRYHHTWLQMPTERIIDDSKDGAIGRLVKQVGDLKINLSDLVTFGWWMTDPKLSDLPKTDTGGSFLHTLNKLIYAMGNGNAFTGLGKLAGILMKHHTKDAITREILRIYLHNIGIEYSVISSTQDGKEGDDTKIEKMFTRKVLPLSSEQLSDAIAPQTEIPENGKPIINPEHTLKDFMDKGIDVRLTRANYRTGRLEIAAYLSAEDFRRYMKKQAWRMEHADIETMPLGSFRLQLPGNPLAIKAALASGRFPGVFAPFPFAEIYPAKDPENELLYTLVPDKEANDASDQKAIEVSEQDKTAIMEAVNKAYGAAVPEEVKNDWESILKSWQKSASMRAFFPYESDTYVDGGSIDNTPSNSAVDATREWLENNNIPKRDAVLELYVIFLEKEPRLSRGKAQDPLLYEVVQRTLAIQSAAVKTSDAVVVDTINKFGKRGDELARSLLAVLEGLEKSQIALDNSQLAELESCINDLSPQIFYGPGGTKKKVTLALLKSWAKDMLATKLPLQVDEIKIYPDDMTLSTLQFTERLGYKQKNAIDMIAMGCYNTLTTIRNRLDELEKERPWEMDEQDKISLELVRKWTSDEQGSERGWACMRTDCVFHPRHCAHGLKAKP